MKAAVEFSGALAKSDQQAVLEVLSRAFDSPILAENTRSGFFRGYESPYPNVVLVRVGGEVAAVAVVSKRTIRLLNSSVPALTVGPLAIHPDYQGQGLASQLMGGVHALASELAVGVTYLQGIPGFYSRYGYHPLLSRSKVVFRADDIRPAGAVEVRQATSSDLPELSNLFDLNARLFSCSSQRTKDDWEWLTKHGSSTYYFFRPSVVVAHGEVVGYFCSDATDLGRIREACYRLADSDIALFLTGLKKYATNQHISVLELMAAHGSPVHEHMKRAGDAEFVELIQQTSGQLLRVGDLDLVMSHIQASLKKADLTLVAHEAASKVIITISTRSRPDEAEKVILSAERLPGLLSGYLAGTSAIDPGVPLKPHALRFLELAGAQSPFIYQGDNF